MRLGKVNLKLKIPPAIKTQMALAREVLDFLGAMDSSTRKIYFHGLRAFENFYGKPVSRFLDKVEADMKRKRRKRKRVAENTMRSFIDYLKKQGYSPKTIRVFVASVQSLAKYYDIPLTLRYVNLPPPIPASKKYPWDLEKIAEFFKLMDVETLALASCIFQSGLSLRDILALNYGDIKDEYESGETRICLDLVRIKTDTPHMTFIGEYACDRLRTYLKSRGKLKPKDPLFPMSEQTVWYRFRVLTKEMLRKVEKRNPCSPHSLRAAFRTLLRDAGCPEEYVEFWMGHNVAGDIRKVYTMHSREGWRKIYMRYEHAITPKA